MRVGDREHRSTGQCFRFYLRAIVSLQFAASFRVRAEALCGRPSAMSWRWVDADTPEAFSPTEGLLLVSALPPRVDWFAGSLPLGAGALHATIDRLQSIVDQAASSCCRRCVVGGGGRIQGVWTRHGLPNNLGENLALPSHQRLQIQQLWSCIDRHEQNEFCVSMVHRAAQGKSSSLSPPATNLIRAGAV